MFGNLFNEASAQVGGEMTTVQSMPSPPGHRLECGLAGIDNQGATCYLNSLLQTLLLTPEFREKLFTLADNDLGSLQNKDKPDAKVRVIPLQLQRLFSRLLLSDQQSVSTADLTNSFGWTNQEEFQQHDVQELNRILFSAIEESLVGTPGQNIINELYHGTIVNQITCLKCKKISEREEDFLDLTLAIAGLPGLEAALKRCYCDVEVMDGRNQYRCETCKTYTDATKGAKLRNLPPVLTLSLLRFSYDFVKMTRYKENGRFAFPMEIDMSPYSEKGPSEDDRHQYELFSVVVHRGSAFGGHYFAYIRDIDGLGHWTNPDGGSGCRKVDPSATGLDVIECQSPVDLIENILGKVSHYSMSIDRLCAEISKVTGVSWNKRFKKAHGPINKFLKSCDSFDYNPDSNWVSLRTGGQSSLTEESPPPQAEDGETRKEMEEAQKVITPPNDKRGPQSPPPAPDQQWFCFNDSHVSPIHAKDIERQFSGKESAYMLFYRQKSLRRPSEAQGVPSYKIPDHLIKDVEDLNIAIEKQRQEFETAIYSISVKVFWSLHFTFNGLLQLKPDVTEESSHLSVDVDKRKTFEELRMHIASAAADMDIHRFSVNVMKPRCGGYHLYEELTDGSATLKDLGFTSNTLLFVWNGAVMDDQFVDVGEACEPVQLLVKDQKEDVVAAIVVGKNKSLADLYQAVTQATTEMDVQELSVCKVGEQGVKVTESLARSTDVSVDSAGLKDGDVLVIVGTDHTHSDQQRESTTPSQGDVNSDASSSPEWSITLHNRLAGVGTPHTCKTIDIRARSFTTIKDLKCMAMKQLKIEDVPPETVRLREDHRTMGLQPPLREGLTLADSGLSNGGCLVLETGRPPQDCEMTISVNKVVSGKLVSKREFLVDRCLTVLDMLQAACKLMDCDGSQWYLSKTDMYGDPDEPLDDNTATLMDLLINDGDTLVLQQGSVIKKDQVCLNLWLAPDLPAQTVGDTVATAAGDSRQEQEDRVMLELAAKLSLSEHVSSRDLNPLNECLYPKLQQLFDSSLVVSKSMGVEELKQALMATDRFQTLRVPTSNFMRLRLIEETRPRAVLRANSQLLRQSNSREVVNLAVQILRHEENLGVHELLLLVAQKIGGTRIYTPAWEFVWNTSAGVGAGDLKKAITTHLALPLHDLLIAKYNPETCVWTVLRDQPQRVLKNNKGKKKSGGHKTNIRQAPYYVQDGDLIGVKILSADKGVFDVEDFSTQEDIEKRQLMQQIAEEKKRIREEKKKLQSLDGFPVIRRPEVPLTIKVDKF